MRSGRLRHRLVLQSKVHTQDAYGDAVVSWSIEATVWGAIEPLSGKEYFSQQQVQAEAKVRIVIRHYSGIDTTWRVSHGGLYYDIEDVLNHDTRNRMITLMCREGVSEDVGDSADSDTNYVVDSGIYVVDSGTQVTST